MRRVLVVELNDTVRQSLQLRLRDDGYDATGVASLAGLGPGAARDRFDFVVGRPSLLRPAAGGGLGRLGAGASASVVGAKLIVILPAGDDVTFGLAAMRDGAHDFVFDSDHLPAAVALALKKAEAREALVRPPAAPSAGSREGGGTPLEMVGASPPLAGLVAAVRRMAPFKTTVLVRGESGTGKELVARALHRQSPRAGGPFVAVNCGAIPGGLLESELFGHVKGTFTDALRDHQGLLERASGGTLFLDEIAELPLELQVKLLRVLEDDRVRRLGDSEERTVDVRLVAATARDLEAQLAAGRFREDLFYRLNVLSLRLPPLRDRAGDVPLLAAHFVASVNRRLGLGVRGISPEAMHLLTVYPWPGNVRELENTIERAAVMCERDEIDLASLPEPLLERTRRVTIRTEVAAPATGGGDLEGDLSIKRTARRNEVDLIRRALAQTGGNRTRAAELLQISHRALLYKIKEYGM